MIEKERKFLLKYMPELGSYFKEPKLIKQGYLMLDKKNSYALE
jgi:oligoribonuclease (3'-5' exoribonuclease)